MSCGGLTYIAMVLIGLIAMAAQHRARREAANAGDIQLGLRRVGVLDSDGDDVLLAAATAAGTIAAMLAGALVAFSLNMIGLAIAIRTKSGFVPYNLLGFEPIVWGLSFFAARRHSGQPANAAPEERLVSKLFDAAARYRCRLNWSRCWASYRTILHRRLNESGTSSSTGARPVANCKSFIVFQFLTCCR